MLRLLRAIKHFSFRQWLFWLHLLCGVVCGLIIFLMSATGVILTYERQLIARAEARLVKTTEQPHLTLDQAWEQVVNQVGPEAKLEILANPKAPFKAYLKRDQFLFHPQTGKLLLKGDTPAEDWLWTVTKLHRWLAFKGDARAIGKGITGVSNLVFVLLALTGLYLWFPPSSRWVQYKWRLLFKKAPRSGQARDFNWHHVFGFWMLIPILIMAVTAIVFSYQWASDLVYKAYGEVPGQRRQAQAAPPSLPIDPATQASSLQARFDVAAKAFPGWQRMSFAGPIEPGKPLKFELDLGNGAQYGKRFEAIIAADGTLLSTVRPFDKRTPASRMRVFIRFLHTGEVYGLIGQTIAGLGSLASLFLVWTGFALSYRRLIRYRRKRQRNTL